MVGVAVNVTFVPVHIVVEDAATITLTVRFEFTIIVVFPLIAGLPVAQFSFDVNTTEITSPFANVEFV